MRPPAHAQPAPRTPIIPSTSGITIAAIVPLLELSAEPVALPVGSDPSSDAFSVGVSAGTSRVVVTCVIVSVGTPAVGISVSGSCAAGVSMTVLGASVEDVVDVMLLAGFVTWVIHGQRVSVGVGSSTSTGVGVVNEVVVTVEDSCVVALVDVAGFCVDGCCEVARDVVVGAEVVVRVVDFCEVVVLVDAMGLCVDDFGGVACGVVAGADEVALTVDSCEVEVGADVVARVVSFCNVVVGTTGFSVEGLAVVACVVVVEAEVVARTVDFCDVEDFGAEVVARVVNFCDVVVGTTGFCVDGSCVDDCDVLVSVVGVGFAVEVTRCVVNVSGGVVVVFVVEVVEDVVVCEAKCSCSSARLALA